MTQAQSAPENKMTDDEIIDSIGAYEYGWHDSDAAGASARRGLNEDVVRDISAKKGEPEWMLNQRLKALNIFDKKPVPTWGADLSGIDFDQIKYYVKSTEEQAQTWDELPDDIKATYDKLGIQRPRSSASLPAWQPSTSLRLSTTRSVRTWKARASSSSILIPHCVTTLSFSRSTSAPLSRPATISSPR